MFKKCVFERFQRFLREAGFSAVYHHSCQTRTRVFSLLDKDLGLEPPLILNAQSSSPIVSDKSKAESLLVSERQFDKVQQADLTLKDSSACCEHATSGLASVSEGQWALDALRNRKYPWGVMWRSKSTI